MSILSFLLFLLIAAACAFIAERLVPNSAPGGFFVSAIIGVLGAWLGGSMVGSIGPSLEGVSLLPCILGSAVFVFLYTLLTRGFRKGAI
jgi:uncharacterized membrane protein YeaQ/YmgE (transglycosylase-associated protein family)